ncbi:hypothetical protein HAP94_13985 [Acidithiobacillus ferrivorans]|nr:hypothetical protein [Acidithiobacillus ferrivorans]
MEIEVTYGQDVPAYLTESVEVPDEIATDNVKLLDFLRQRAQEKSDDEGETFDPSWNDMSNLRIVSARQGYETLLEDEGITPQYWDTGLLLSTFYKDGNTATLVSALSKLGFDPAEVEERLIDLFKLKTTTPRVVVIVNEGMVNGIMADRDITALVVDYYNAKGISPEDDMSLCLVPQLPGVPAEPALVNDQGEIIASPPEVLDRYWSLVKRPDSTQS